MGNQKVELKCCGCQFCLCNCVNNPEKQTNGRVTVNQEYHKKYFSTTKNFEINTNNKIWALKLVSVTFSEFGFENDIFF